jgi:hypothetical protein
MAKTYGLKPEQAAPVRKKYGYKICRRAWNRKTQEYDGCGKLFTADSYVSECPECGTTLSRISLDSPPEKGAARVILEKCAKCVYNLFAQKCLGSWGTAAACGTCRCRECCREQAANVNAVLKGERSLADLARENIRKRAAEEAAKERERREKNGVPAAVPIKAGAKKKPMAGLVVQAVATVAETADAKRTDGGNEPPIW